VTDDWRISRIEISRVTASQGAADHDVDAAELGGGDVEGTKRK
jgi:hypothetical protein